MNRPRRLSTRLAAVIALLFGLTWACGATLVFFLVTGFFAAQVDRDLRNELREFEHVAETGGLASLAENIERECMEEGVDRVFFRVFDRDGAVLLCSDMGSWIDTGWSGDRAAQAWRDGLLLETREARADGSRARVALSPLSESWLLETGTSLRDRDTFARRLVFILIGVAAAMTLAGGLVGWGIARRAMDGVRKVTAAAAEISTGHFDQRVEVVGDDEEVASLVRTFNRMAGQVETTLRAMREINDNIAHDLRSPITRMRGVAETALLARQNAESESLALAVIEDCDNLLMLINTMLDISDLHAGVGPRSFEPVRMDGLVRTGVELFESVAEDQGVALSVHVSSADLRASADPRLLQRALANLLDNALKHTPRGGRVEVLLEERGDDVVLSVEDTGSGIAPADLPRIFDRFYRAAQDRSTPGNGLGLSLAQAIAHSLGGRLTVRSTLGEGSCFALALPRLSRPAARSPVPHGCG